MAPTSPVRVLILDPDERLCALLRSTLEGAGFDVRVARSLGEVRSRGGGGSPDVVLLDVTLFSAEEAASIRGMLPVGARILLTTGGSPAAPETQRLESALDAVAVLRKPFSFLDLADTVREHARSAPAAPDALADLASHLSRSQRGGSPSALRNATLLAQLWARRRSGSLTLATPARDERFALSVGGVEGAEPWVLLQRALAGDGQLRFQPGSGSQLGDWAGVGAAIYDAAGSLQHPELPPVRGHQAVLVAPEPEIWQALPLPPAARAVLARVAPDQSLDQLALLCRVAVRDLLEPLRRLQVLGLVQLGDPRQPAGRQGRVDPDAPTWTVAPTRAPRVSDEAPTWSEGRSPHAEAPTDPGRSVRRGASPSAGRPASPPPRSPSRAPSRSPSRSPSRAPSRAPRSTSDASRASDFLKRRRRKKEDVVLHQRLQGELDRLKGATPWVVLGIPQTAPPDLASEAASRQRRRYRHLSARPDLPEETRALGRDLAALVDKALGALSSGAALDRSESDPDLLSAGRRRIEAGAWEQADRVLTRARDKTLSDPAVLANLGWARLHNPERSSAGRIEEGRDLLLLAEQLAPDDAEALMYLARFFVEQEQPERAIRRLKRLLRSDRTNADARALLARCEAMVTQT